MKTKELKGKLQRYERAMPSVARKGYRDLLEKAFERLERLYDERKELKDELGALADKVNALEGDKKKLEKVVKQLEAKLAKCAKKDGGGE